LALAGIDSRTRKSFVWVRVVKNGAIVAEVVQTSGAMFVRCRECLRFHKITVVATPKMFSMEVAKDVPGQVLM
jgi:hypothetical protein